MWHKICDLSNSLEFTLESQNGEDVVKYGDGKLSFTVPRELESYCVNDEEEQSHSDARMRKDLIDKFVEYFLVLIEKFFSIKFENRQSFYEGVKNALSRGNIS